MNLSKLSAWALIASTVCLTAACTSVPSERVVFDTSPRPEKLYLLTADQQLLTVRAAQPERVLTRVAVQGLAAGEQLVGIDFRVARGILYGLSNRGRLVTIDTERGVLTPVGAAANPVWGDKAVGFDFNPAADRLRVVAAGGLNMRLHPDTGATVDGDAATAGWQPDPALAYVAGDPGASQTPEVVAAAYTYNKNNEKLTTNYALDRRAGTLVMQGSREGTTPVVSPNTGQLRTVGTLGLGSFVDAAFDIADVSGAALAVIRRESPAASELYLLELSSGRAQYLGRVGDGAAIVGMAIEP